MRFLIASMVLCCCAATGYSQESTEAPAEVTITEEGGSDEVVRADSKKQDKPTTGGGCGCGKPKL